VSELTLEALAKRVEALEQKLAEQVTPDKLDWLKVVGISKDNEFTPSCSPRLKRTGKPNEGLRKTRLRSDPPRH
jgi:hypothetical protein